MSTTSMASTTAAQSDSTLGLTHPDISGFSKHATSRDYILDLADPSRPSTALFNGETRVQKHPAVFKCSLCPKKFTRAYNLRSHLRTHTEERSFICSICGKAFVRQHDLTRHEGLHSGEVKFMCAGQLQTGQSWGCGRRFARADALGRHFRSEAGRVCIKPLLDEEAATKASVAGPSRLFRYGTFLDLPAPLDLEGPLVANLPRFVPFPRIDQSSPQFFHYEPALDNVTASAHAYGNATLNDDSRAIFGNVSTNNYYIYQDEPAPIVEAQPDKQEAFIAHVMKAAAKFGIITPEVPHKKDKDAISRWVSDVFEAQMCATTVWDGRTAILSASEGTSLQVVADDADRIRSRSTGAKSNPWQRPIVNSTQIPGPGVLIDEVSEYYYSSDDETEESEDIEQPETLRVELPPRKDSQVAPDELGLYR